MPSDFDVALHKAWKRIQSQLPTDQLAAMTYVKRLHDGWQILRFRAALHNIQFRPDPPEPPEPHAASRWQRRHDQRR